MNMRQWIKTVPVILMTVLILPVAGCDDNDDDNGNDIQTFIVPDDFATIQLAINAASDGDEVIVLPGVYPERIDFIGKNIIVRSDDPDDPDIVADTVINAMGQAPVVRFAGGETEAAGVRGFTLTGGDAGRADGGAIVIDKASSPVISGNIITENEAAYGGAILVTGGSSPLIEKNIFTANTATSRRGAAIYVIRQSNATITENIFTEHTGGDGVIHVGSTSTDESSATITTNTFEKNTTDFGTGGIKITAYSSAIIKDNTIKNNAGGGDAGGAAVTVSHNSDAKISGNIITGNTGTRVGAIVVYRYSSADIIDNVITGNSAGTEDDTRYGSGGGISIIYFSTAEITGNTLSDNTAWNQNGGGGGIRVDRAEAVIDNNIINRNTTSRWGGGIYLAGGETLAVITNNTIKNNRAEGHFQATGGGIHVSAEATITGNTISNNWADWHGGGVYVDRNVSVNGVGGIPWIRMNFPADTEMHNIYADNDHGNDQYGGADVFFSELM